MRGLVPLPTCSPSPVARACRSSAVPVVWISADPSRCVGSQSPVRRGRQRAAFPATAGQPHMRRLPHLPSGAFFGRCWAATDPGVPYWLMVSRDGLFSTPGVMAPSGPGVRPGAATSFIPSFAPPYAMCSSWSHGQCGLMCLRRHPQILPTPKALLRDVCDASKNINLVHLRAPCSKSSCCTDARRHETSTSHPHPCSAAHIRAPSYAVALSLLPPRPNPHVLTGPQRRLRRLVQAGQRPRSRRPQQRQQRPP